MWVQEKEEYADEVSGTVINRAQIDAELRELEAKANIRNPNDFRKEVTDFSLRYLAQNRDKDKLKWTDYEKLRLVIEKKMFSSTEDLLPIISFNSKSSTEDTKKHEEFVQRMIDKGYTAKQVETLVTWYVRVRKSH
jgi:serine protein kinase